MEYKKSINKIKALLGVEVKLAEIKSADGSVVFVSETFESGDTVVLRTDDGDVPVPMGSYELEDGRILTVEEDGIVGSVASVEEEAPEMAAAPTTEAPSQEPKKLIETITKEHHFAEMETKDKEIERLKSELKSKELEITELSKVKPIVTNPESKVTSLKGAAMPKSKNELYEYLNNIKN